MAAEAETRRGGHMEDVCSCHFPSNATLHPSCGEGDFDGGRRFSWKFCRRLRWQTDVADYRSAGEKLTVHSDSIHSSLKARKRPSGEVITQEALLQGRDRRRL